jgi:V/A-type H+-transporting ATPase subunit D
MAELKLNKTSLRDQMTLLAQLTKYLPTLQLKKQQLQMDVEQAAVVIETKEKAIADLVAVMAAWKGLLSEKHMYEWTDLVRVKSVATSTENVAGVDVPVFQSVAFETPEQPLVMTPEWYDEAQEKLRAVVLLREEIRVLRARRAILEEELRQAKIKVNLFEKRMIPSCRENIKRIRIFLGDLEIAALCNAKIAKAKLNKARELSAGPEAAA